MGNMNKINTAIIGATLGIMGANFVNFIVVIPFFLSLQSYLGFIVFFGITILTAIFAGVLTKGNKNRGIIVGVLSTISILILLVIAGAQSNYARPAPIFVFISYFIGVIIIGIIGGIIGNYFSSKRPYSLIIPILLFVLFVIIIFYVLSVTALPNG